jgi:tetratricopeptide (TPR) repeat protein
MDGRRVGSELGSLPVTGTDLRPRQCTAAEETQPGDDCPPAEAHSPIAGGKRRAGAIPGADSRRKNLLGTWNAELHPESSNVYDSLGEAYMDSGDKNLAIQNDQKSLDLDPRNSNATDTLKKLKEN